MSANWDEVDVGQLVKECFPGAIRQSPAEPQDLRQRHRDYLLAIEPAMAHLVHLHSIFLPRYLLNTETGEIQNLGPDFPPWAKESIAMAEKMIREIAASFGLDAKTSETQKGTQ